LIDIKTEKNLFRRDCILQLREKAKNKNLKKLINRQINRNLQILLQSFKFKTVMFYLPLSFEADLRATIRELRQQNKKVFVPYILDDDQKAKRKNPEIPMKAVGFRYPISNLKIDTQNKKSRNKFGVAEANYSLFEVKKIDIVIIPVIGIDKYFKRIGFGKGMYDRFYSSLQNKPLVIFVQLNKCSTQRGLTEPHDVKADYYITFNELLKIRGSNDTNRNHHLRRHSFIKWIRKHDCNERIH